MRVLVHDYAGHPFQIQLSRELANRGHHVTHCYSQSTLTPQGSLQREDDDAENLQIKGIKLTSVIKKNSYFKRVLQEREYGKLLAREIKLFGPDVVISGNTPLEAQKIIQKTCRENRSRFVFWVQDFYGIAVDRLLRGKLPVIGGWAGSYYMKLEERLLHESDEIVLITQDFRAHLAKAKIPSGKIHVIENWAPLEEVPLAPKENKWSKDHGLEDKTCLVYSGTLGMKHNPNLLLELALQFRKMSHIRVVVISEGQGAEWLKKKKDELGLDNLILKSFQPFKDVPFVLGSADVLIAILEPDAGTFSVPSKVLTYHCAGKALLLSVPEENLSARIVNDVQSGLVAAPGDLEAFKRAANQLVMNELFRRRMGVNARNYAEEHFDITSITNKFERVLQNKTAIPKEETL